MIWIMNNENLADKRPQLHEILSNYFESHYVVSIQIVIESFVHLMLFIREVFTIYYLINRSYSHELLIKIIFTTLLHFFINTFLLNSLIMNTSSFPILIWFHKFFLKDKNISLAVKIKSRCIPHRNLIYLESIFL